MKYKNFRCVMPVMLLLWLMFTTSSCVRDEFADESGSADYSSVTIKVKMPELSVTAPGSRAVASDFDVMDDINIFIATGDAISDRIYVQFASVGASGSEIAPGVTITYEDVNEYRVFQLNFSNGYWEKHPTIPIKTCGLYVVANWGRAILSNDANTVTQLRNLKVSSTSTDISGNTHSTVDMPNRMFGEIVRDYTEPIPSGNPGEVARNVEIELNRTAAMLTLVINGAGLSQGVVIDVKDVNLRNVPRYCTIGRENNITQEGSLNPIEGAVSEYGDRKGGALISGGYRLVGTQTQSWTDFGSEMGYRTSIGKHYADGDYDDVTVQPLFLYENMHGGDAFGADESDQGYKRPAGVDRDKVSIENNTKACSYIEINADYMRYEMYSGRPEIREKGTATWRFFLGGDVLRNFDVKRNTHYKLTLTLSGRGITENTWRVDAETKTSQVVGDADMVVGGGGEMFCVELTGDLSQVITNGLKLSGPTAEYVYVRTTKGSTEKWLQVSEAKGNTHYVTLDDKQIWFYVRPLLPNDKSTTVNERTCSVEFQNNSGTGLVTVSFTQYRPVTFSITQADLNNYPTDENLLKAKAIIEKYYDHDFGTGKDFVFYVDRVDRGPMQWGFNGVLLDRNQNTGFENVYHLIDPKPVGDNCKAHVEYAKNYLPTGKGWKDGNHIDYSRGSCMMHAAMENYFQQYYPYPGATGVPDITLEQLANLGLPSRPVAGTGDADDYSYSWCVPSIVGYQVMEKLDAFYKAHNISDRGFDPKYPITKWVSYWTSNFGALDLKDKYPELDIDGRTRSFAYQFDMGLDKITENDLYPGYLLLPRTSMLRYRLINIRPNK